MTAAYQTPDHDKQAFARTNPQTIAQRANLLAETLPDVRTIAEICCGDCFHQWNHYHQTFALDTFTGLDIDPLVVDANRARGVPCICGDALDPQTMRAFLSYDVLFFGPPLSTRCDGHSILPFRQVVPGYATLTGTGEPTGPQLKYVEIWLSPTLEDKWEIKKSDVEPIP